MTLSQGGDGGEYLAPVLPADGRCFGRPDWRVVWRAPQPGDTPCTVHAAAAIDHRRPQVRLGLRGIIQPGPAPAQPEERVLHHILCSCPVAREQQREAGHADGLLTVEIVDVV